MAIVAQTERLVQDRPSVLAVHLADIAARTRITAMRDVKHLSAYAPVQDLATSRPTVIAVQMAGRARVQRTAIAAHLVVTAAKIQASALQDVNQLLAHVRQVPTWSRQTVVAVQTARLVQGQHSVTVAHLWATAEPGQTSAMQDANHLLEPALRTRARSLQMGRVAKMARRA